MNANLKKLLVLTFSLLAITAAAQAQPSPPTVPSAPPPPKALYLTWQRDPVTTMTVHWHSDWIEGYRDTVLEYRPADAAGRPWARARGDSHPMPYTTRVVHTVELTGLSPDTVYVFRLGLLRTTASGEFDFVPDATEHRFRTLPARLTRPVRFVSGGDANIGGDYRFAEMNRAAASRDPDFALMGGDIAYVNNRPQDATKWFDFLRIWGKTMRTSDGRIIPIVPAIGNHETNGDTFELRGGTPERGISTERGSMFYGLFAFPGRPGYNVLDAGGYLSVIALDSHHTSPVAGPQTEWLRGVLEKRRGIPFIVPLYHVPAYPSYRPFAGPVSAAIRANWVPLFEEAGVRFAFENHDHAYKVTHPLRAGKPAPDGVRYLGDGAWSVEPRAVQAPDKAPYLERAHARNHIFVVTLHPDRAEFTAIDPDGVEFDRFTIGPRP